MDTLKIVSTDLRTQGPFVVINKSDFNPDVHELYGDQDLGAPTERAPTMAELLVARDQLLERERSLDAEKERIAAQEQRLADQAQANEVEAQRLRDEAASLQAAKDAAAAATLATSTEKPAKAAKA
ncbi:hypothetical protein KIV45_15850 [Janthinobacterium lividum]|nr:hypothetical protein KIV45_15850 [Janthinobacterium lividum]